LDNIGLGGIASAMTVQDEKVGENIAVNDYESVK
jgi:hypothetical protein